MKHFRNIFIGLIVVILGMVPFFKLSYPTGTFQYKITAEVMTPDGLKTGSSVIEVSYSSVHPLPNPGLWRSDSVTGEAVYVDLGGGKNLFITLGVAGSGRPHQSWNLPSPDWPFNENDYARMDGALGALWLPIKIFNLGRTPGAELDMENRVAKYYGTGPRVISPSNLPTIVTFKNLNDSLSAELVDPHDLVASYGEGYSLKAVYIEIVNEKPAQQIRHVLPWLSQYSEPGLVKTPDPTLPKIFSVLRHGHFSMDHLRNPDGYF